MHYDQQECHLPEGLDATAPALPLANAPAGMPLTVLRVHGGGQLARRMADLGILPGRVVHLRQKQAAGARVVDVQGSRVALGENICRKIMVCPA